MIPPVTLFYATHAHTFHHKALSKKHNVELLLEIFIFYAELSLHAKNDVCRSNGVTCGQCKDKEEKGHKTTKNKILKNSHSPKDHIFITLGCWVEKCDL